MQGNAWRGVKPAAASVAALRSEMKWYIACGGKHALKMVVFRGKLSSDPNEHIWLFHEVEDLSLFGRAKVLLSAAFRGTLWHVACRERTASFALFHRKRSTE
jgi:hypothetical protein